MEPRLLISWWELGTLELGTAELRQLVRRLPGPELKDKMQTLAR